MAFSRRVENDSFNLDALIQYAFSVIQELGNVPIAEGDAADIFGISENIPDTGLEVIYTDDAYAVMEDSELDAFGAEAIEERATTTGYVGVENAASCMLLDATDIVQDAVRAIWKDIARILKFICANEGIEFSALYLNPPCLTVGDKVAVINTPYKDDPIIKLGAYFVTTPHPHGFKFLTDGLSLTVSTLH